MSDAEQPGHVPARRPAVVLAGRGAAARAALALALGMLVALLDARAYLVGARLDEHAFDAQVGASMEDWESWLEEHPEARHPPERQGRGHADPRPRRRQRPRTT